VDLTVVVVSYNTKDLLARCLATVREQITTLQAEIVVVDNASTDGSPEMLAERFPKFTVIRNGENHGFAHAVNQGILAGIGRHILLLNSDATIIDGSVEHMVAHLDAHPRTAAVGGMLLNPDGTFQGSFADFPTLLDETLLLTGLSRWLLPPTFPSHIEAESTEARAVDWVCGAFMMLKRRAVEEIGRLDEDYFMYAEEVDWCLRARCGAWSVDYLPEARAIHLVGASYGKAPIRRRAQMYRSKWLYLRKHHGALTASVYRRLVQIFSATKLVAWGLSGIAAGAARRERAQVNVASYRHLLSHF
jgi:GT2 family glycosyltransferase